MHRCACTAAVALVLVLALFGLEASAENWYLAPDGQDNYVDCGTNTSFPCASLDTLVSIVSSGDTILLISSKPGASKTQFTFRIPEQLPWRKDMALTLESMPGDVRAVFNRSSALDTFATVRSGFSLTLKNVLLGESRGVSVLNIAGGKLEFMCAVSLCYVLRPV